MAEASGENIFMVNKKGMIQTPAPLLAHPRRHHPRHGAHALRDSGREVEEVTFTRDALYIANEIFFTGTAAEITPVREVDNRQVGTGQAGPGHPFVQETYFRAVRGQEPRYAEWLTYV